MKVLKYTSLISSAFHVMMLDSHQTWSSPSRDCIFHHHQPQTHLQKALMSLLQLPDEILAQIVEEALSLRPHEESHFRHFTWDLRLGRIWRTNTQQSLLQTCRRLRRCAFEQILRLGKFTLQQSSAAQSLIDYLRENGVLSGLRNIEYILDPWPYQHKDNPESWNSGRGCIGDAALIISQLPADLRSLKILLFSDTEVSSGASCPDLLESLRHLQRLERLSWECDLSMVPFELHRAPPSYGPWRFVSDCNDLNKYPRSTAGIPWEDFREIPFVVPRPGPMFGALRVLTLTGTVSLLPHQMEESLSRAKLPELTDLRLVNIRWRFKPEDVRPCSWPISPKYFAGMNPLTSLVWRLSDISVPFHGDDEFDRLHAPPTTEILDALRKFHGDTLARRVIDYSNDEQNPEEFEGFNRLLKASIGMHSSKTWKLLNLQI